MTDERASGIILRTRPLTDTSLIVHWLTPELGRIATVAKGARKPKSSFYGKLDLFFEADFSFARSRRSELHTLREVGVRDMHNGLRTDFGYVTQASYAVAFVEQVTETETPLPEVHELLTGFLAHLPKQPPQPRSLFAFELKLLGLQGLEPDLENTTFSPAAKRLIQALTQLDWPELPALRASGAEVQAVRQFLHGFIIYHCQSLPKGRAAALTGG
jgi:DNA repair protein RecO (recombination protein O)